MEKQSTKHVKTCAQSMLGRKNDLGFWDSWLTGVSSVIFRWAMLVA
jgi:hypothetical protein